MSLLCLMAFAQQRVNTHDFGICGDNQGVIDANQCVSAPAT
jgi:hypothetical protein